MTAGRTSAQKEAMHRTPSRSVRSGVRQLLGLSKDAASYAWGWRDDVRRPGGTRHHHVEPSLRHPALSPGIDRPSGSRPSRLSPAFRR
jgi:hypothetical protein